MPRKATTYRIDPVVQTSLSTLSKSTGPVTNQLVKAARDLLASPGKEVEKDAERKTTLSA